MKRFALVCGATGGIGKAIVKQLASDGWSLYLHYFRSEQSAWQLQKELTHMYPDQEFLYVQADLTDAGGAEQLARQLFSVQAVVFASGHAYMNLLEDTAAFEMERLWRAHVQNPMLLLAKLGSKLRMQTPSYVLFISSIWGTTGAAMETVYSAVKGAQQSFVKAYAKEAASFARVNAIAPGFVDTKMNVYEEHELEAILQEIPLGRFGQPEDIAAYASFLLSNRADYMTGQIIQLNGGWYI